MIQKYTDRDLERALRYVEDENCENDVDAEILAAVYMDERERFADMCDDYAHRVGAMRSLGATYEAQAATELANMIRKDRGGK